MKGTNPEIFVWTPDPAHILVKLKTRTGVSKLMAFHWSGISFLPVYRNAMSIGDLISLAPQHQGHASTYSHRISEVIWARSIDDTWRHCWMISHFMLVLECPHFMLVLECSDFMLILECRWVIGISFQCMACQYASQGSSACFRRKHLLLKS